MEKEFELLNFDDYRDIVISAEDASDSGKYRHAKEIAEQRGVNLTVAAAPPKSWQPPDNSLTVAHDVTAEEYQAAKSEAAEKGLDVVVAPETWEGPRIKTGTAGDVWTPPPNTIVVPHDADYATWTRACEAAKRLGVKATLAPPEAAVVVPEKFSSNSPIVIPKGATPTEYRRLKALAESRKTTYHIAKE